MTDARNTTKGVVRNLAWWAVGVVTLTTALMGVAEAGMRSDPAFGHWLTANERAIVRIDACAEGACGEIVWTARGGSCGARIIGALGQQAPGRWSGGYVEDPRDGTRYSALLAAEGDRLTLRGYVGLPVLGKSQTWTRVTDDRGGC